MARSPGMWLTGVGVEILTVQWVRQAAVGKARAQDDTIHLQTTRWSRQIRLAVIQSIRHQIWLTTCRYLSRLHLACLGWAQRWACCSAEAGKTDRPTRKHKLRRFQ